MDESYRDVILGFCIHFGDPVDKCGPPPTSLSNLSTYPSVTEFKGRLGKCGRQATGKHINNIRTPHEEHDCMSVQARVPSGKCAQHCSAEGMHEAPKIPTSNQKRRRTTRVPRAEGAQQDSSYLLGIGS